MSKRQLIPLKVWLPQNGGYMTLLLTNTDTAKHACDVISKRHDGENHCLYVVDSKASGEMFERSLGDLEMPVQIQANAQNRRKGSTFKFVFKEVEAEIGADQDPSSDEEMFPDASKRVSKMNRNNIKCGYLQKKGKVRTGWRERWFALQEDKLYYFKDPNHSRHISFIPVRDAIIRQSPVASGWQLRGSRREWLFEIDTKTRVFYLKAQSQKDMNDWIDKLKKSCPKSNTDNVFMDDLQDEINDVEYEIARRDEARSRCFSKLGPALANTQALDAFASFLIGSEKSKSHSKNYLLFLLEVMYWQNNKQPFSIANDLITKYLDPKASCALARCGDFVEEVRRKIRGRSRKCFQTIYEHTFERLQEKFYLFLKSQHYRSFLLYKTVDTPPSIASLPYRIWLINHSKRVEDFPEEKEKEQEEKKQVRKPAKLNNFLTEKKMLTNGLNRPKSNSVTTAPKVGTLPGPEHLIDDEPVMPDSLGDYSQSLSMKGLPGPPPSSSLPPEPVFKSKFTRRTMFDTDDEAEDSSSFMGSHTFQGTTLFQSSSIPEKIDDDDVDDIIGDLADLSGFT